MHKHCGLCRDLEHRNRDCEEQGAEKGVTLAKMNVPGASDGGLMAAGVGAWRWQRELGFRFWCHLPYHTRASMIVYKKASPETTVEVTKEIILPVDGFGTIKVGLDQPGTIAMPVKMVAVARVPELSLNLLSIRKVVKQGGKPLV